MVNAKSVDDQLKKISFTKSWNRRECEELAAILLPDEELFECVNGWYEGGFALLCATNIRVLLIDKKPLKYLNMEDVRFDTINQIDYSHQLIAASICISAGLQNLRFKSYDQPRLRKLISHVQHSMTELKQTERQPQTVEAAVNNQGAQPSSQYLPPALARTTEVPQPNYAVDYVVTNDETTTAMVEDGLNEVFGKYRLPSESISGATVSTDKAATSTVSSADDISFLKIAYSKLPMLLSLKKIKPQIG